MAPAPLSWPPSQYWWVTTTLLFIPFLTSFAFNNNYTDTRARDGDDGSWSSFALRVGSSGQVVRVLPSTAGQETWVVSPQGCHGTSIPSSCNESRGCLFDATQSSSWHALGNYTLGLEQNLGDVYTAPFGLDTIALGFDNSMGGPTLDSQVISALATDDYYIGLFGLGHQGTNISNFTDPHPSFLTAMHNESLIPSLSWAYTAGAQYQVKGVPGSLTFGGYDRSRFFPNGVSLFLATDISRDLVVGLQSISSTTTGVSTIQQQQLLRNPILTFIDSTLPYIYLPIEACQQFEKTLGLAWDDYYQMYLVNDTLHRSLSTKNLSFTFTIGDTIAEGPVVQIVLPYASFDLEAKYPFMTNTTRYFPLQRAVNESQYTLGRTFLQEAYIIVDYERSNFSVSQCRFEDGIQKADLVAIPSATETPSHIRRNIVIETSIGTVSFLLLATFAVLFAIRRWRRKATTQHSSEATEPPMPSKEPRALIFSSAREIGHNSMVVPLRELPDSAKKWLNEQAPSGSGNEVFEMSEALPPESHELRTSRGSNVMIETRSGDRWKILFPTKIPRKSWTSVASCDSAPGAETVVAASAQRKEINMDRESIVTSNLEAEIYSLYLRPSLDLDKSLPPTPISESPQVSPFLEKVNGRSSLSAHASGTAFLSPEILVSTYLATTFKQKGLSVSGVRPGLEDGDFDHSEGAA